MPRRALPAPLWLALVLLLAAACDEVPPDADDDRAADDDAGDDDTAGDDDAGDDDAGDDDAGDDDAASDHPAIYPPDRVHSPIPATTAAELAARAAAGSGQADVFMKVGDSHTASSSALFCFAGGSVDLGDHGALEPTLDHYLAGDAAGSTPFDRDSLAAAVGMNAGWALDGSPSPLQQEWDALDPSVALVQYGSNDMQLGVTYASALPGFHENMAALLDTCLDGGVIPVVMGIPHRADLTEAGWWVPTYNDVIRGMAQERQIPYVDLRLALEDAPGQGLGGDGLHLDAAPTGSCDLSEAGLAHGNNVRNLLFLEGLDRLWAVTGGGAVALDDPDPPLAGDGSPGAPLEIPWIGFTDARDTAESPHSELDHYSGCDSDADESGPEWLYRLELTETTHLRAIVLDLGDVDIDIHLLDETASEAGCLLRGHHMVEGTLAPGTYHLSLDTWVDGEGTPLAGEYLLVVSTCHPDDPDCPALP